jgi:hypothetical protein
MTSISPAASFVSILTRPNGVMSAASMWSSWRAADSVTCFDPTRRTRISAVIDSTADSLELFIKGS